MTIHRWIRWVLTGLMAALMVTSAVPDVLQVQGALSVFRHLGYPPYLLPFLGIAKLLGVAAIIFPMTPRLREWAFAGLTFDLTGAAYSHLLVGDPPSVWLPAAIGLALMAGAYAAHRLRRDDDEAHPGRLPDADRAAAVRSQLGLRT